MVVAECPICLTTTTVTREHVWPRWFLKRMDLAGAPPFAWSLNGVPILDRAGNPIRGPRRQRVMLDVCGPCNATMNTKIETPAKSPVTALALNHWAGSHEQEEWRSVGLWWAKVLLLAAHDEAKIENPRLQPYLKYTFDPPMPDLRWLTDGTGIPTTVSVFAHHADLNLSEEAHELTIPAQGHFDDGHTEHCHMLTMATPGLCITVVSHPGIQITHPMVERGEAWELLRTPPGRGDVSALPAFGSRHVKYLKGGGVPEGHDVDESEFAFLTALFGYDPGQLPPLSRWARIKGRLRRLVGARRSS